ncbi:hypothetical protein [Nonomuraea sediminis]|uniref:hypothetical protein n=1 Tax=Nonomuraea sediminis TaxID=2835864 RepID=UPI001BDC67CA|nr:hypothetical protein [Nonomuraea sediminis]
MKLTLRNTAAAVLLAVLGLLLGAPAASAHGGPIVLEVSGDGGHGVNVVVTWKKDRHPVRDTVIGTVSATSSDGRSFGPVKLVSAPEGQNLYRSAQPLPTGEWHVTVTAAEPSEAKETVDVIARDIAAPEQSQAAEAPQQLAGAPVRAVAATDSGGLSLTTVFVIALGIAAAAVAGVVAGRQLLRRKQPDLRL